jgi:hypothetical protein
MLKSLPCLDSDEMAACRRRELELPLFDLGDCFVKKMIYDNVRFSILSRRGRTEASALYSACPLAVPSVEAGSG